jgi:hypothetical protein
MADTHTVTFKEINAVQGTLYNITFTLKIFRNSVEKLSQDYTEECSGDLYEVDYATMAAVMLANMQATIDQWKITHDEGILMGMGYMGNGINAALTI